MGRGRLYAVSERTFPIAGGVNGSIPPRPPSVGIAVDDVIWISTFSSIAMSRHARRHAPANSLVSTLASADARVDTSELAGACLRACRDIAIEEKVLIQMTSSTAIPTEGGLGGIDPLTPPAIGKVLSETA